MVAPAPVLSRGQRRTLSAICDTFLAPLSEQESVQLREAFRRFPAPTPVIPDGQSTKLQAANEQDVDAFAAFSASDSNVVERVEKMLADGSKIPPEAAFEFKMMLSMLGNRLGMLALVGHITAFADLPLQGRVSTLVALRNSSIATKRKMFMALKSLVMMLGYANAPPAKLAALGYRPLSEARTADGEVCVPGPGQVHSQEFRFQMLNAAIRGDTELSFDAVVVGSGCGGAVVAAELAAAGRSVLVLEKGEYVPRGAMPVREGEALDRMYERGALCTTRDGRMAILAGAAFGGGSSVNWACCIPTPEPVRREWAEKFGLTKVAPGSPDFEHAQRTVWDRLGVQEPGDDQHNPANSILLNGCRKLGYHAKATGQSMVEVGESVAEYANFISVGDRHGLKTSAPETWLQDAAKARQPAQFADRCFVERIVMKNGRATGVRASIVGRDGKQHRLTVNSRVTVAACGSIHSPALLLRSKIPNPQSLIGKNLRLHPVTGVAAMVPHDQADVAVWRGAPMTSVSNVVADGRRNDYYGGKLEVPSVHPGMAAFSLPWSSPAAAKQDMLSMRRLAVGIMLTRDIGKGQVTIGGDGLPRVDYALDARDSESMVDGIEKLIRVFDVQGCERLLVMDRWWDLPKRDPSKGAGGPARKRAVEELIEAVRRDGCRSAYRYGIYCAHQMGSLPMGSNRKSAVVRPSGETWEVGDLFVADTSVFPTPSGANPMMTVYTLGYLTAQQVKARLDGAPRSADDVAGAGIRSRL